MTRVQIAIDDAVLASLVTQQQLCLAQVTALDPASKHRLWQLCLECCQRNAPTQKNKSRAEARLETRIEL
ncbi:hypothetical protein [Ferrimonas pelagia]|uniref:Uncharacterized protein n=1 Tax=Ferrimonas pelagia TaxID=1177826 RepID=A0ABP9F5P2_9GAMM